MKPNNKIKVVYIATIIAAVLGLTTGEAKATDEKQAVFSARVLHGEQQKDNALPFFNFDIESGRAYELKVELSNLSSEKVVVVAQKKNALTTPYGTLQYTKDRETRYSSFVTETEAMDQYVQGPEEITLRPKEKKEVVYTVAVPKAENAGEILGALGFMEKSDAEMEEKVPEKGEISLVSRMEYVIAIYGTFPGKEKTELNIKDAKINLENRMPKVNVGLENKTAVLLKNLEMNYRVYKKPDLKKPVFENTSQIERFAPSTRTDYFINFEGATLEAGEYVLEIEISGGNLMEKTNKTLNFTIDKEDEKKYIQNVGQPTKIPMPAEGFKWWWIGASILVFILVIYARKRRKRK